MNNMGIIGGYSDGRFRPDENITRGELAAITGRFAGLMGIKWFSGTTFTDISGHWAEWDVNYTAGIGWYRGDGNGIFRPDDPITRAEFMSLVNRMLERVPKDVEDVNKQWAKKWPDNMNEDAWYYIAVQEATNSHIYDRYDNDYIPGLYFKYEYWTDSLENRNWVEMERKLLIAYP
jgi:hypothetical protein